MTGCWVRGGTVADLLAHVVGEELHHLVEAHAATQVQEHAVGDAGGDEGIGAVALGTAFWVRRAQQGRDVGRRHPHHRRRRFRQIGIRLPRGRPHGALQRRWIERLIRLGAMAAAGCLPRLPLDGRFRVVGC